MNKSVKNAGRRPVELRRSWLFLPGADRAVLEHAADSGADVAIQEFEDFTVPERRPEGRALCKDLFKSWRGKGLLAAVRINPLEHDDGMPDLEAAMAAAPDIVMLPKTHTRDQIVRLDKEIASFEKRFGLAPGSTEIVPNIESAAGLVNAGEIAKASTRVTAMLVASEDMVADLGAERSPEGGELAYVRARFLVECVAAGVTAIDCPHTFADDSGAQREALTARSLGYTAKSAVVASHAAIINNVMTPAQGDLDHARRVVDAFEDARRAGAERAEVGGHMVELPSYLAARRLIDRTRAFAAFRSGDR